MSAIIRLEGLSKTYGNKKAVDSLSFKVEQGQIYGFLGANGAGKTTSIKMLLSLIKPSSGEAYLFDTPIQEALQIRREKVGALVEDAAFYPFMTAKENLETLAYIGAYSKSRIGEVLRLLGLQDYPKLKLKNYSTGMKQRLGIAAALLHNPELLILDEPTNGLDPQGIQALRLMLRELAQKEGKTIFLSSHILHEVEQICDTVAIIHQGRLIREGTVASLLAEHVRIRIETEPLEAAQELLSDFSIEIQDKALILQAERDSIPSIVKRLTEANIAIYEIRQMQRSLEDLFLELTNV